MRTLRTATVKIQAVREREEKARWKMSERRRVVERHGRRGQEAGDSRWPGKGLRRLLSQRSSASHGTPGHRRVNANVARVPCVAFVSDR